MPFQLWMCVFRCVAVSLYKILCVWTIFCPSPSLFSTQAEHLTQLVSHMAITVPSYLSLSLCICVSTHEQWILTVTSLSAPFLSARPSPGFTSLSFLRFIATRFFWECIFRVVIETHHENQLILANGVPFMPKALSKLLIDQTIKAFCPLCNILGNAPFCY